MKLFSLNFKIKRKNISKRIFFLFIKPELPLPSSSYDVAKHLDTRKDLQCPLNPILKVHKNIKIQLFLPTK